MENSSRLFPEKRELKSNQKEFIYKYRSKAM